MQKKAMHQLLVFHPTIAPYRIAFFNDLSEKFGANICLYYKNLKEQTFDYQKIEDQFCFEPEYFSTEIKIRGRFFYPGHIFRIFKYKPKIVMVGEYGFALWAAVIARLLSRSKFKIVTICDDSQKIAEDCSGIRKKSRDAAFKHLDGIILCNDQALRWYEHNTNVPCFSFPIIQKEEDFYWDREEALQLAQKYSAEYQLAGKRVFLFVGRLAPEKNLEYLVRSFIAAHPSHPENVLCLIGGESEKDVTLQARLEKLIQQNNAQKYIQFLGRKEGTELKAWYYLGQVLVLPSISECFGAVVNEALLAGEYVMVSQNAGAACLVNGNNGEVIDISCEKISFDVISQQVKLLSKCVQCNPSKMPYSYEDKMDALLDWLEKFRR